MGRQYLPLQNEVTFTSDRLDVLVELDHGHVLGQVSNEHRLQLGVLLGGLSLHWLRATSDLEIAALCAKREGSELTDRVGT